MPQKFRRDGRTGKPTIGFLMRLNDTVKATLAGLGVDASGWMTILGRYGETRYPAGLCYSNTAASTAIAASSAEALFDTQYSIPANALRAGARIRIRFGGIATATVGTDTLTIKLYIGGLTGTALITMAATDVANNDVFTGEYELLIRTIGASGTMVGQGTYKSIPAAEGTMTIKDDILASTAIDTTVAQVVAVSGKWSTTNANSCRLDFMTVEIS